MMKYDSYKSSGVSWFGSIPETWTLSRLKELSLNVKTGTTPTSSNGDFFSDGTEIWFTPSDLNNNVISDSNRKITKEAFLQREVVKFPPDSVFLIGIGGTLGKIGISTTKAGCNQQINVIVFDKKQVLPKYGFYLMLVVGDTLIKWSNYTTMPIFTQTNTKQLEFLVPPIKEQTAIAEYLDTKTQAIDKKVSLLEKKIGYYQELRKSLIQSVVFRGLDYSNEGLKLKDSGISYIKHIPEHWTVERIKDQFYIGRGRVISQEELLHDGKYPVFSSQTENNDCLGFIATYDFDTDLLTWTTDGVNAGTVFKRGGKFSCTNVCGTLKPKRKNLDLGYTGYALHISASHNKRIDTNGAKIMNGEMAVIQIPFPPLNEQKEIAKFLDAKLDTIAKIITNIQTQIITLKELRKTLINDVVTGKIKVSHE